MAKPIDLPEDVLAHHLDEASLSAVRGNGISLQSITVWATKPA